MEKIIQNEELLRVPSEKAKLEEAKEISKKLFEVLDSRGKGDVGLAASQIGILKQVCVIRAKIPIVLVNPVIVDTEGETWYQEGCLSFPGASVRTKRYDSITVKCDYFGELDEKFNKNMIWHENKTLHFSRNDVFDMEDDRDLLESVAAQHEIDHNNGILMFDREWKQEPVKSDKKVGRNDLCPCGSGLKHKKCCGKV